MDVLLESKNVLNNEEIITLNHYVSLIAGQFFGPKQIVRGDSAAAEPEVLL